MLRDNLKKDGILPELNSCVPPEISYIIEDFIELLIKTMMQICLCVPQTNEH
jgi:hypothetical protein